MGKINSNSKKMNGIVKLNSVAKKLQKSLQIGKRSPDSYNDNECVPKDVEEGHFAVVAVERGQRKRFVVPLCMLSHPPFLSLLEQAAEEYGFNADGVITLPCSPTAFERILATWGI